MCSCLFYISYKTYPEPGGHAECKDKTNCKTFVEADYCTKDYVWYMKNHCAKSCKFCGGKLMRYNLQQRINHNWS